MGNLTRRNTMSMSKSRQTDYVNAQFDDAEARIESLYDEISKQDTAGHEYKIALQYVADTWSWFWTSNTEAVFIWKEKGRVHLSAFIVLWHSDNDSSRFIMGSHHLNVPSWGIPNRTYADNHATGEYMSISPDATGITVSFELRRNKDSKVSISASWKA